MMPYIILPDLEIVLGLAITAVVSASIDLKRIRKDTYSMKGKGFDITGVVINGLFIF